MNLNSYDYQQKVKTCGSFTVYKPAGQGPWYDGRCLVKAICPNPKDVKMVAEVARRLTNLSIELEPPSNRSITYAVKCHPITLKGVKRRVMEVFTIINKAAQEAVDWLEKNCTDIIIPGVESTFDTSKLSVGPCAYRENSKVYVKVRFDGISIPFYYGNNVWDRESTHKALVELNGPALAADFCEVLAEHQETILERAADRPLNLCGIAEGAMHRLTYWIEQPAGVFQHLKENSPLMSIPGANIVPVAEYGYTYRDRQLHDFVLVNDELYRIQGYHELKDRHRYINGGYQVVEYDIKDYRDDLFREEHTPYAYGGNLIFKISDLTKVPEDDMFVREKVIRTLKAKL